MPRSKTHSKQPDVKASASSHCSLSEARRNKSAKQQTLFPAMDAEIRDERKAARRERVQHARQYLKDRDLSWLINHLLEHGPQSEHMILLAALEEHSTFPFRREDDPGTKKVSEVIASLVALNIVGKLWKCPLGIHPGSGEESFLFGIRRVHQRSGSSAPQKENRPN